MSVYLFTAVIDTVSYPVPRRVLALNAGSSSIKFALYDSIELLQSHVHGKLDRIGLPGSIFTVDGPGAAGVLTRPIDAGDPGYAANGLVAWLQESGLLATVDAVGHRVVHGGTRYDSPAAVDDELTRELRRVSEFSPEHLPAQIELIERLRRRFPDLPQVACFDTAFHHDLPRVAQMLPIPRRLEAKGIRRFGFHGLSYAFLMGELERLAGPAAARGRVILAHLGNGSSLAAIHEGRSVDTTMAFTPASGIPMSTRSGSLDPGLAWYLARSENMSAEQFNRMVNHESGLLGISETSSDMRELLAREATDVRAAEAVALYCYEVSKSIGALATVLRGLDTLVFSGGIGENAPLVRERICERLAFLGVALDDSRNKADEAVLCSPTSAVTVRMIRTDEEAMIARATYRFLLGAGSHA